MDILNDTTFYKEQLKNPNRKIEFEVGDSKQSNFFPQFKTMHWDNECNFSIRYIDDLSGLVSLIDGRVVYDKPKEQICFYEIEGFEDGGFEFEIILKEKPASNILNFSIQSKGFDFFYQPELTQTEIQNGFLRPKNVVGSYAVYHKTKKNNKLSGKEYRTGKAFHIYRPFVIDFEGNKVWCDLNIDNQNSILSITISQNFLDNAKYPILIDPTFGYTTEGTSTITGVLGNDIIAYKATAPENGNVSKLSVLSSDIDVLGGGSWKGVLATNNDLLIVTNGVSNPTLVPSGTNPKQWFDLSYSTEPSIIESTIYLIGVINNTEGVDIWYDSGASGDSRVDTTNSYTTPQDWGTATDEARKYSIYATYTASEVSEWYVVIS